MKTKVIGIIGLALLGVAAGGCSAENAGPQIGEETDIGSTAQALTTKDNLPTARQFPASCVINGKMLIAGGYDSTGAALSTVYLFDPAAGAGSQWVQKESLSVATGEAEMIAIPGTDECLFVGGKTTPTSGSLSTSYIYDLSNDTASPSDGWTAISGTALSGARANFALSQCGKGSGNAARIIAIGGKDSSTYRDTIQVFNVGTQTWSALTTLSATRAFPAVAPLIADTSDDNRFRNFIIAGGENGSGKSAVVDLLLVNDDCTSPDLDAASSTLSTARSKAVALADGNTNALEVCGGSTAAALATDTCEKFVVTTWGSATVTRSAGPTMNVPRTQSKVVPATSAAALYYVVGGRALDGDTVSTGQVWDTADKRFEDTSGGTGTPTFAMQSRYAGAFERTSNNTVASAAGLSVAGGVVTFLTQTETAP